MDDCLKWLMEAVMEKKALNPIILDLKNISPVADYFLICSGNNSIQVKSIADRITEGLRDLGRPLPAKEGYSDGRWILLDFGQVVVHIMHQTEREFYALEKLWHDAKIVSGLA